MSSGPLWRIIVTARAEKDLKRLPLSDQARVRAAIDILAQSTRGGDRKKLKGMHDEWRLRVGRWRIRFTVDRYARAITLLHVLSRGGAYRE